MKPMRATEAEQPEIYAIDRREMPAIRRAAQEMAKHLRGLSDVSQKQAITELTVAWIMAIYPDSLDLAISLSDAMRDQTDIDLQQAFETRRRKLSS
ncbi:MULTISPECIES: hypothetical protein [unclassified Mesorhizobium]|uniref:hypothetical protein n=1 Tax=unclassified Mesorhizobium TaxID=325217 RepID=UPI0011297B1F|nr:MULTISPECIES: hypothetical protein [unclassified Mesorhizobium]TPJ31483.1 hypothetical protein FJ425_00705 [Mesorhizobium sp. B2-7-2]TPO10498.1 hypothetical protein FJ980_08195 [Mesorhizobium sp. B1-1-5]